MDRWGHGHTNFITKWADDKSVYYIYAWRKKDILPDFNMHNLGPKKELDNMRPWLHEF